MPYIVSSKYEDRWKKLGKNIYDIYMINHEISDELKENFDFSFEKKLENFDFTPKVYDNFVIHLVILQLIFFLLNTRQKY